MKSIPDFERLCAARWRRRLTAEEEAQLQALLGSDPELEAVWQAEGSLNEGLERLPAAPVPSNFTAQVLEAVERARKRGRRRRFGWASFLWRIPWLPRVAVLVLVLGGGLVTYQHDLAQKAQQRKLVAQSLITVSELRTVANPEIFENFDAIQAMSQTPSADEDLLRLLQ